MTLVMAYVILLAAVIGACSAALDGVLERNHVPRRWIWVSSLGLTVAATALAMVWPVPVADSGVTRVIEASTLVLSEQAAPTLSATPYAASRDILSFADALLPFVWLISSTGLLLAVAFGQRRLRRERKLAQQTVLAGQTALVSEVIGPAVAGLRTPVVFVPRWVLALDEPSQRLLMAHEMEHVRKRDTVLLFFGAFGVALVPWNPVAWWMVRRLRLAVEQDCDARVLATHPGVRRYADLLLLAASRHGLTTRLLAAHFGEHSSDLVRRIDTMTRRGGISWRRTVSAMAIAGVLLAAACETPRPAPVAPIDLRNEVAAPKAEAAFTEVERQIEDEKFSVLVFSSDGKQLARYAGEIPVAHLPKDGVQSFKADEYRCGESDCYAVRITLKPGFALNLDYIESTKVPLKRSENTTNLQEMKIPEIRITRDSSEMVVTNAKLKVGNTLRGPGELSAVAREIRVDEVRTAASRFRASNLSTQVNWGDDLALYHLYNPSGGGPVRPPNTIIYNSQGSEIARFDTPDRLMWGISAGSILKREHLETGDCSPLACPLTRITLKPGYKLVSYQEWKERHK